MSPVPTVDQAELILLARQGDIDAFSQLMEAEQPRLLGQALAFCQDPHLAQDLVQETMIAAWKSLSRFDGTCRLFTWLYVILLRQHRRSQGWFRRRLPLANREQITAAEQHPPVSDNEATASLAEEGDILRQMIEELPTRHREVVRLRFYGQASEAEIASALGIAPGTVKSRLSHALEKLRRMKEKLQHLQGQR